IPDDCYSIETVIDRLLSERGKEQEAIEVVVWLKKQPCKAQQVERLVAPWIGARFSPEEASSLGFSCRPQQEDVEREQKRIRDEKKRALSIIERSEQQGKWTFELCQLVESCRGIPQATAFLSKNPCRVSGDVLRFAIGRGYKELLNVAIEALKPQKEFLFVISKDLYFTCIDKGWWEICEKLPLFDFKLYNQFPSDDAATAAVNAGRFSLVLSWVSHGMPVNDSLLERLKKPYTEGEVEAAMNQYRWLEVARSEIQKFLDEIKLLKALSPEMESRPRELISNLVDILCDAGNLKVIDTLVSNFKDKEFAYKEALLEVCSRYECPHLTVDQLIALVGVRADQTAQSVVIEILHDIFDMEAVMDTLAEKLACEELGHVEDNNHSIFQAFSLLLNHAPKNRDAISKIMPTLIVKGSEDEVLGMLARHPEIPISKEDIKIAQSSNRSITFVYKLIQRLERQSAKWNKENLTISTVPGVSGNFAEISKDKARMALIQGVQSVDVCRIV
ncbi:MAG: hypothetical protein KDK50_06105, partial [Chlamydiia bacterium]|nr:hypothetical protein [Chlamydiia bacterium]